MLTTKFVVVVNLHPQSIAPGRSEATQSQATSYISVWFQKFEPQIAGQTNATEIKRRGDAN